MKCKENNSQTHRYKAKYTLKTKEGPLPSAPQVGHDEGNGGVEYGYRVYDEPSKQAVRSPEERREFRKKPVYV
jgi:hypothetical protein